MDRIVLRMNLLGGMNAFITEMEDEDFYGIPLWLSEGVPDGATEEDLREIAENDEQFTDICSLFGNIVKYGYEEGYPLD